MPFIRLIRYSLLLVGLFMVLREARPLRAETAAQEMNAAQSTCEKTLSQDPHNREALFMLGLIYEKKKQPQAALDVWKRYVAEETDPAKRSVGEKHIHHLSQ